ncbi:mannosyl-oligosaccharide alpha-1,2-mannosidase IA [Culicoides brevitarsis]|uniref:mannosyl-oligosaccharide alpha-1,2-mannosidase IA n=1 Tax=Culicoides brevitarsis TaxID=469753 RepID=UPI00307BD746
MLPTYNRMNTINSRKIWSCRNPEKLLILLVVVSFCFVCFGAFFLLPDNFGSDKVTRIYKHLKDAPEIFLPAPPIKHGDNDEDIHMINDREKLREKISNEMGSDILEKPETAKNERDVNENVVGGASSDEGANNNNNAGDGQIKPPMQQPEPGSLAAINAVKDATSALDHQIHHSEDKDPVTRERRNKVKEMLMHAWNNYKTYAWGKNELRPLSKRPHTGSIFGAYDMGATIVDALDTLFIMGMKDDFDEGREWVAQRFNLDNVTGDISVFETNIRFVGGFLALYALTGDPIFKEKAQYTADKLLPAFQTPTGIPYALINFRTGSSKNYAWASGASSILSEFGTLHLEFAYLSDITGNPIYKERVNNIRQVLKELEKPKGLYPNYLNPKTGKWGQQHMSLGALGDSYYEYLLKAWLQSDRDDEDGRQMFDDAMAAIMEHMIRKSQGGLTYVSDLKFDRLEHKMDHLACFAGGLFGLAANTLDNELSPKYMEVARGLTNTCHESYIRTATHLGPESFRFTEGVEAKALKSQEKYYILRPETFESYFIMWRLTHDQKYRDWGWDAVQALENYCRTPNGYTGIKNVYQEDPVKDDVQQSFFLAETLKYLYLLFSDDSLLPLDEWVFNTEAHPLPIKNVNNLYRPVSATVPSQ